MAESNRSIEIGTGLFVLLGFAALGFLTTQLPGSGLQLTHAPESYSVVAKFDNIGGLRVGAPVTMSGVRVGTVSSINYDATIYKAAVGMSIERKFDKIPDDSDAAIQTAGLLGANYVSLDPGGSDSYLKAGGEVQFTQSAIVLENLINKLFSSFAGGGNRDAGSNSNSSADSSGKDAAGKDSGSKDSGSKGSGKTSGGKPK
jgi:phospholipid/cholesterol/gamma-HCH transport system substrate-binding protein